MSLNFLSQISLQVHSSDELYNICKKIKNTDILKRIELPKSYHNKILNTMCMYYSFSDFDYKVELEKIYNGFEQLLINSNIIINKEYPFFDFNCYIKGEKIVSFKERLAEI